MGTDQETVRENPTISLTRILAKNDIFTVQGSSCEIDVVLPGNGRVDRLVLYTIPRGLLWQRTYIGHTDYSYGAVALFKPGLYKMYRSVAPQLQDDIERSRLLFSYAEVILPLSIKLDVSLQGEFLSPARILDLNVLHRIKIPKLGDPRISTVRELLVSVKSLPKEGDTCLVGISYPGLLPFQKMILYNIPHELIESLRRLFPDDFSDGAIALFTLYQWELFMRFINSDLDPLYMIIPNASLIVPLGLQQNSSASLFIYHQGEAGTYASTRVVGLNLDNIGLPVSSISL